MMKQPLLILLLALASCGETSDTPQTYSETVSETKPRLPRYDDIPPLLTGADYQLFDLSEMGLSEKSSFSDATDALDFRYRKGAMIIGNRVPYPSSVYTGDQLLASYAVLDPDDPKYYLRHIVVGFHNTGPENAPIAFAIGVRHVCREVQPLEWTKEHCPELS